MSFASEFREFAIKGNVVDLAVGVIIGGAFGKIVDSLVNDLIMPVVGKFTGGLDFQSYFTPLAGIPVIAWGSFLQITVNFIILALVVFLMVKQINRLRREQPKAPPAPPEEVV